MGVAANRDRFIGQVIYPVYVCVSYHYITVIIVKVQSFTLDWKPFLISDCSLEQIATFDPCCANSI